MPKISVAHLFLVSLIFSALLAQGCGSSSPNQPADKAERFVDEFLDCWARGESPDKLADRNPSIQVSDPDWKAGYRLTSFLIVETKQDQGTPGHVQCRVALSLADRKANKSEKEVKYDVRVGDKIVIGRAVP
jgi:hypothetical protein